MFEMPRLRVGISIDSRTPDVWRNRAYRTPVILAAVCLRVPIDFGTSACRR
ncbi:hypothetical protein [Burkholderia pseudomallei]|uniref:hypothetical protein n=1 Tax=Burkholderia pseudomallei TaxID=28450 RepID=UPI000530D6FB|nr:hypothetical protein [Burkholderia pseudomallei]KGS56982.1 putative s-(Hydroxymethyl)glutathione dehydrogenase [Burkholderia pseudomallei MSHR5609]